MRRAIDAASRSAVSVAMWCAWCVLRLPWLLAYPFSWLAEEVWWQRKLRDAASLVRRADASEADDA